MYQILIVDDEELVRQSVTKIIDWSSLGFSQIYQAEDGLEALDICRKKKIDLVLTDIVMPFMDGLELTKILNEEFPDIHVVVLTGHEDFEYAKKSVTLGVKNYILKPVGASTLYNEMKKICKELNLEASEKEYINNMRVQLRHSLPLIQEKFLHMLISPQRGGFKYLKDRIKVLDLPLNSEKYIVGIIELNLSQIKSTDLELFLFTAKNISIDCVGAKHCVFDNNYNQIIIIFNLNELEEGERFITYNTLQVILKAIASILHIDISGAVGTVANGLKNIYISYSEANKALDCRYSLGENKVYDISDLGYIEKSFYYPFDEINDLINNVKFYDNHSIELSMKQINNSLVRSKNLSITNIKLVFIEIVTTLLKQLADVKHLPSNVWEEGMKLYNQVEQLNSVSDVIEKLEGFAKQVSKEYQIIQTNSVHNIAEITKEYIYQNYSDENITLTSAAEHSSVSTGYLSALFKKETGKNFVEYLTAVRMEKAMELLRGTDNKNYEIAYEVGYSNPHYFSVSFKKFTGVSPSEFRKRI